MASRTPASDELEFIGGHPIVHSHVGAPCTRCGAMDLHTLHQCAGWTAQVMAGQPRTATRIVDPHAGDARHEVEGMTAVPDTAEPWATRLGGPHPPAVSRAVGALLTCTLSRTQALMVAYTLADAGLLAWDSPTQMLREFSAATGGDDRPYGTIPEATEFGEGAPEHDGPVLDQYGCAWSPSVRPGDGFRGWVHHLPGPGLPPVWLTWGQLTIQRGPLTAVDIPAARR